LRAHDFSGGEATVAQVLRKLGFEMRAVDPEADDGGFTQSATDKREFWWVNHKQTFTQEVEGNYLWSPTNRSDGGRNEFYENMKRVRPGDIVFSFADAQIRAVGICKAPAVLMPKPSEFGAAGVAWQNEGWRVPVSFRRLGAPIRPKDHMYVLAATLPEKYSPIRKSGDGNQGVYLAAVPPDMAAAVIELIGQEWSNLDLGAEPDPNEVDTVSSSSEGAAAQAILNRTDIGETEKLQLVQSRRGQGVYRKNLEGYEKACRVTGVTHRRHLRASHIKPWRASNNFEKLDGNNGLLLSPHIDHLFDQGYISFTDDGDILVSDHVDRETLDRWGVEDGQNSGAFREAQLPYLAFHRDFIFKA
jgi:hypothetical protein